MNNVVKTWVTDSNRMFDKPSLVAKVIKKMHDHGCVVIDTNYEGYSASEYGLYELLDMICEMFGFDKSNITIQTTNKFESHSEYNILIKEFLWPKLTVSSFFESGLSKDSYLGRKTVTKNVFGSFNNRPSWYRLCLANHLCNLPVPTMVSCNTSWEVTSQNLVPFDLLAVEVPTEFYQILEFVKTCPRSITPGFIKNKDNFVSTLGDLFSIYNDFFIDVIGVTFTTGDTFYMDEKETRAMLCCTPFIVYGTAGYLETLRGFGFKTFGDFWDESYDSFTGYARITEMYKVIDTIAGMSPEALVEMYASMLPVLEHNFNQIVDFVNHE